MVRMKIFLFLILFLPNLSLAEEIEKFIPVGGGALSHDALGSDSTFAVDKSVIRLISPRGGETLDAGAPVNIIWESSPGTDSLSVALSLNGGTTWSVINTSNGISGGCLVHLPLVESSHCLIRIYQTNKTGIFDQTPEPFTIAPSTANPWTWKNITGSTAINGIATRGDYIWCATPDGLVRWDVRTMESKRFDGPPNSIIQAIAVGSDGSIWMGTTTGVVRFDGKRYTPFSQEGGLPFYDVDFIAAGPNGEILAGMQTIFDYMSSSSTNWISRFDRTQWTNMFQRYRHPGIDTMTSIAIRSDTDVWAVIAGRLNHYDGVSWKDSVAVEGMEAESLKLVACDSEGGLWITGGRIVSKYSYGKWENHVFPGSNITALAMGPGSIVGVATVSSQNMCGISVFDGTAWKEYPLGKGGNHSVAALAFDSSGSVWAGTSGGLYHLNNGDWTKFSNSTSISAAAGEILGTDRSGSPVLSLQGGFLIQNGTAWDKYLYPAEIDTVKMTVVAPDGVIWVGSSNGLHRFDGASWVHYSSSDGLPETAVTGVYPGLDGILRIKTNGGFYALHGNVFSALNFPNEGLGGRIIRDLVAAPDGTIWVVLESKDFWSEHPLPARLDGERWTILDPNPEGENGYGMETYLSIGKDGSVWASISGNWGGSVMHPGYSGVQYQFIDSGWNRRFSVSGGVTSLVVESGNIVWVGATPFHSTDYGEYLGGGLYLYQGMVTWFNASGEFYPLTSENSDCLLPDNKVSSLALGPDGALWVRTATGLTRFGKVTATGVNQTNTLPYEFAIRGNFPNPFNPSTTIAYSLPAEGQAKLTIYSITGQKIRTLVSGRLSAGDHAVVWDGRDERGMTVSSGVYISRLESGKSVRTARMLLLK